MYASLLGLVCTAIFDYLLIPDWGGMGAVLATIFSYIATSFYVIYQFWRINDCSIPSLLFLTKKDIQQVKQYLLHAIRRKIL
jgi:Na+-driven multidrug efflux pump